MYFVFLCFYKNEINITNNNNNNNNNIKKFAKLGFHIFN